MLLWVELNLR